MKLTRKKVIFYGGLLLAAFFFVVWIRTQAIRKGYEVSSLKETLRALDLELAETEIKLMQIKSPKAAARRAKEQNYKVPGEYPSDRIRYIPEK